MVGAEDEVVAIAALKNLRGRKIIRGDRVFVVRVESHDGRLAFGVDAYALRDLHAGRTEALTPEPIPENVRRLVEARKNGPAY